MVFFLSFLSISLLAITGYATSPTPGALWTAAARRPPIAPGGSVFANAAIQANGGRFWLDKNPSAYCPPAVAELNCTEYPGNRTVFMGGNDTLSLGVGVPGGQQSRFSGSKNDAPRGYA